MTSNPSNPDRRDERWPYSRPVAQWAHGPTGTVPPQQIAAADVPSGAQSPGQPQPAPPQQGYQPQQPPSAQATPPVENQREGPRIDLLETPDELLIVAELPGFDENDVVLEGLNQQIRIVADRDDDYDQGQIYLRERPLHIERTVTLPIAVSIEDAEASFVDGVCRIRFPKREETRTHRIGFQ